MSSAGTPSDVGALLEAERPRVEAALERARPTLTAELPESLAGPLEHSLSGGGKRLRPVLCATAYRASAERTLADTPDGVYDLAVSLELIHTYSLMHDDLPCMDDAELRRGRPTPHTLFGERATLLAGAVLIPGAADQAWRAARNLDLPDAVAREVVRRLLQAAGAGGMVGGQFLDLLGEGVELSGDELTELHGRKTGALLTASLVLGGVAGGASRDEVEGLEEYGRALGLAFQITDDVLDATASVGTLGKVPSDHELSKSTYVRSHGVDGARAKAQETVNRGVARLQAAGFEDPVLEGLGRFVVERDR